MLHIAEAKVEESLMGRSVGLAFQGGGAKVIGLIAAADAISELMGDGEGDLKVGMISGTSAGSLAALLLAAGADFGKVKVAIRDQENFIRQKFAKPNKIQAAGKMARFLAVGKPFYRAEDFNSLIEKVLLGVKIDINNQLQDVCKIETHVVLSDIFRGRSVALSDGPLRDILRRSCAIPFVFGSHRSDDQGQFADGGIFDNLPVDILMNNLPTDAPVFAIGFEPERVGGATGPFDYVTSIVGSVVTNNVGRSRESIGEDFVCPIDTELGTLDFDKMISVGLNFEYDAIKAATKSFFKKWLQGESHSSAKSSGPRAFSKLKHVESTLVSHVEKAFRAVPGCHEYVKMSVVANSLEYSHLPDDIIIEQLLVIPAGYSLHGTIIPLLDGSGTPDRIACVVKAGGPDGRDVPFTQFLIDDELERSDVRLKRNSLAILIPDTAVLSSVRKLYISKKETRFGFMAPLRGGEDSLSLTASYWPADMISLRLCVPGSYADTKSDWTIKGDNQPLRELPQVRDDPKVGWCAIAATLERVNRGGQIKGLFTRPPVPSEPKKSRPRP